MVDVNTSQPPKPRRRRKAPPSGWLLTELCEISRVSSRTIGAYVRRGVLARPKLRGRATRYDRDTLLRLTAVRQLKLNGVQTLDELRRQLDKIAAYGLERWVMQQPVPARVVEALRQSAPAAASAEGQAGATTPTPSPVPVATPVQGASAPARLTLNTANQLIPPEGWRTIVLVPGLQLCIADSGGSAIQKVAARLCEQVATLAAASIT